MGTRFASTLRIAFKVLSLVSGLFFIVICVLIPFSWQNVLILYTSQTHELVLEKGVMQVDDEPSVRRRLEIDFQNLATYGKQSSADFEKIEHAQDEITQAKNYEEFKKASDRFEALAHMPSLPLPVAGNHIKVISLRIPASFFAASVSIAPACWFFFYLIGRRNRDQAGFAVATNSKETQTFNA